MPSTVTCGRCGVAFEGERGPIVALRDHWALDHTTVSLMPPSRALTILPPRCPRCGIVVPGSDGALCACWSEMEVTR